MDFYKEATMKITFKVTAVSGDEADGLLCKIEQHNTVPFSTRARRLFPHQTDIYIDITKGNAVVISKA